MDEPLIFGLFHHTDICFFTILGLSALSGSALKQKYSEDDASKIVNQMAWLFLAVLAVESFSKHELSLPYLISGIIFLFSVTLIAIFISWCQKPDALDYLAFASCTFGGGNRGYALISSICLLPLFSEQQKNDMITAFLQIDAVIFVWLMVVIPTLFWFKNKNTDVTFIISIKNFAKNFGASPFVVMGIILLSWAVPDFLKSKLVEFLGPSHDQRSALLLYLSLTYVFMRTNLAGSLVGPTSKNLFLFYLPRVFTALIAFILMWNLIKKPVIEIIFEYSSVLPFLVFVICPPSNGLNNFMESYKVPREKISEIMNLNIITTIVFAVILVIVSALGRLLFKP